jgi:hypothetical protein
MFANPACFEGGFYRFYTIFLRNYTPNIRAKCYKIMMQNDVNESETVKDISKKEYTVRKEATGWCALSDAGFIGLVATEIPEFLAKESSRKIPWRLPAFLASSASVVVGVVMSWIKGSNADALHESILEIEEAACAPKDNNEIKRPPKTNYRSRSGR